MSGGGREKRSAHFIMGEAPHVKAESINKGCFGGAVLNVASFFNKLEAFYTVHPDNEE